MGEEQGHFHKMQTCVMPPPWPVWDPTGGSCLRARLTNHSLHCSQRITSESSRLTNQSLCCSHRITSDPPGPLLARLRLGQYSNQTGGFLQGTVLTPRMISAASYRFKTCLQNPQKDVSLLAHKVSGHREVIPIFCTFITLQVSIPRLLKIEERYHVKNDFPTILTLLRFFSTVRSRGIIKVLSRTATTLLRITCQ